MERRVKLSLTQLATEAGLSLAIISFVELELGNPTLDRLMRGKRLFIAASDAEGSVIGLTRNPTRAIVVLYVVVAVAVSSPSGLFGVRFGVRVRVRFRRSTGP